jgi:hypothetical protein
MFFEWKYLWLNERNEFQHHVHSHLYGANFCDVDEIANFGTILRLVYWEI